VTFYRRRLPHLHGPGHPILLIWLLYGSLPPHRFFPDSMLPSGKAFAVLDRLLDQARTGPFYLRQAAIAEMIVDSIHHHANTLHRYSLHAFVVMPNHVYMLMTPRIPLPRLTKALKGFTAKRANQILGRTGNPFWQEESYDHLVRNAREGERIRFYIEQDPVRAGLVRHSSEYPWSSAGVTRRSPADPEVRPTRTIKVDAAIKGSRIGH
jgi:REP element-mobilizing transposase RayT